MSFDSEVRAATAMNSGDPIADVPIYDVSPACRAAVTVMPGSFEACMKAGPRAQLAASWDRFTAAQPDSCVETENAVTCLPISHAAQSLPERKTDGTNR